MRGEKPSPAERGKVLREAEILADGWRSIITEGPKPTKANLSASTGLTPPHTASAPHNRVELDPYGELKKRGINFTTPSNSPER